MAAELIKIYSARRALKGFQFPPDTLWQEEFESLFEYEETPDQITAHRGREGRHGEPAAHGPPHLRRRGLRQDRGGHPRRLQGGHGRPAGGRARAHHRARDAAFLHLQEALRRLPDRDRHDVALPHAPARSARIKAKLADGKIDIIIGTHALLAKDMSIKNLGLLIIDEEQRFGVRHKEQLKKFRTLVDVLTLSATPIPRTLHMAMAGIRDLSIILTPPENRQSIETYVLEENPDILRMAIISGDRARRPGLLRAQPRADHRGPRRHASRELVPEATCAVAHGQMHEHELEDVMIDFLEPEVRRPGQHLDHRVGPRHAQREHHHHQPRRHLRPLAALPAQGARRALRAQGLRLPLLPEAPPAHRGGAEAPPGHRGILGAGERLQDRHEGPGDPGRRQHPGPASSRATSWTWASTCTCRCSRTRSAASRAKPVRALPHAALPEDRFLHPRRIHRATSSRRSNSTSASSRAIRSRRSTRSRRRWWTASAPTPARCEILIEIEKIRALASLAAIDEITGGLPVDPDQDIGQLAGRREKDRRADVLGPAAYAGPGRPGDAYFRSRIDENRKKGPRPQKIVATIAPIGNFCTAVMLNAARRFAPHATTINSIQGPYI